MKTIGLIGGMSFESTAEYYRMINEGINKRLGGLHSAECILYSVDFEIIERCQSEGRWGDAADILKRAALLLEQAGADFIVICTNTMHKVLEYIQKEINIPVLHIADATAQVIKEEGIKTAGLLGTKYTMEQDFYKGRIKDSGINIIVPDEADRELINTIIFEELCRGKIKTESKEQYCSVIRRLADSGAEGIILGCTEIGLLINQSDSALPLFDTTEIHAHEAVNCALANEEI